MANPHLFTSETARIAGKRGNEARAKIREAQRTAAALASQLASEPTYTDRIKARVRAQIELTLSRIDEELARGVKVDGAKLDKLASALERLAELERLLDGRPAPGTRRPAPEPAHQVRPASPPPAALPPIDPPPQG